MKAIECNINKFKNEIRKYEFESKIEIDDNLKVLLIEDSTGIESIPLKMIYGYYIYKGHIAIYIKESSYTMNFEIKSKVLQKAV